MSITQNDFKKIWASTSSVPEYTFSDADYRNGWEFVGELPPTRAMWDTLQRRNDQKMKYLQDNGSMCFDSVADMVSTDLESGQTVITKGYYSVNDGGAGLYNIRAVVSEETYDDGSLILLDNGNVAELITDGTVNVKQFGAVGDGVTDDTTALRNAINSGYTVYVPKGHYICTSAIANTMGLTMYGDGDETILDFGSSVPSGYALTVSGSLEQIGDIGNASMGDVTVTFNSAPDLVAGDVFCIFNPTAKSWSEWRDGYNAGEWCEVRSVSGNVVTLANPLYDSYVGTDVEIWKMNSVPVDLRDFRIVGTSTNALLRVEFCKDVQLSRISSELSKLMCLTIYQCYNALVKDCSTINYGTNQDDYGLAVSNSQKIKIVRGNYYARRHGIMTGGDASNCHVTCRNIRVFQANISNNKASGTHAADMHGNTEDMIYDQCNIDGGVSLQGKNITVRNCNIISMSNGIISYASEINGGSFTLMGCTCKVCGTSTVCFFYFGYSSDGTSKAKESFTFRVIDCELNLMGFNSSNNNYQISAYQNFGTNYAQNFEINGLTIKNANANAVSVTILYLKKNSGGDNSEHIIIDNIVCDKSVKDIGVKFYAVCYNGFLSSAPMRIQKQNVDTTLTIPSGSNQILGAEASFPFTYPRIPSVSMCVAPPLASAMNTAPFSAHVYRCTNALLRPYITSTSNVGSDTDLRASYSVCINDV